MIHGGRRAPLLLFFGDIAVFVFSLWLTLWLRAGAWPSLDTFQDHLEPFSILFLVWALIFYMSGLYGKRTILFKSNQPQALVKTQAANIIVAALFFFLVPGIGISPKTSLLIYLGVSLVFIIIWRLAVYPRLSIRRTRAKALCIAEGEEARELIEEVNGNSRYQLLFTEVITPRAFSALSEAEQARLGSGISVVVADPHDPATAELLTAIYRLPCFSRRGEFIEFADLYEEVFDRVPLSLLGHGWFLENLAIETPPIYAFLKRAIDIIGGLLMGLVTLVAAPFVWLALRLEGPGPLFIEQERIGYRGARVTAYKFRSMRLNKSASREWTVEEKSDNPVTKVGAFLRRISLDEFPQFMNVLKGEISLIGPRNDVEGLGRRLAEALPYYTLRYLVTPGITGWAQINQQYEQGHISPQSIEETKVRLAYDFYYIKHRSIGLDLVIALKTVKRMFFRLADW